MSFAPCQIKTKLVSQALISFWALDLSPSSNRKLFQAKVKVERSKLQFEADQSALTVRAFLLRIRQVNRDRKKGNSERDWGKESKKDHCNFNFTSCRPLKLQFASGTAEARKLAPPTCNSMLHEQIFDNTQTVRQANTGNCPCPSHLLCVLPLANLS